MSHLCVTHTFITMNAVNYLKCRQQKQKKMNNKPEGKRINIICEKKQFSDD